MIAYKTIMAAILLGGSCLAALINPIIGVSAYLMVYQINPSSQWWGKPLAEMGVRFSLLAGVFTVLGIATAPQRVAKCRPALSLWEMGAIALMVIAYINTYLTGLGLTAGGVMMMDKYWKMTLFVLILGRLASTRQNLRIVLWCFVVGSLYLGHDAYTSPASTYARGRLEFVGGPDFSTTSGLSAHLSAMLPLIGVAFLMCRSWRWRLLAAASGAFSVNAIILCRTRSAFIGLAAGVLAALLLAPRAKRYRIHACIVLALFLSFGLTDHHFWDRMATMSSPTVVKEDTSTADRIAIWKAGVRMFMDYPYGVGLTNFQNHIYRYEWRHPRRGSHSTPLIAFVELGMQGGVIFLGMTMLSMLAIVRSFRLAPRSADPLESRLMIYGAAVAYVTYFVTGLATERLYCESFWWIFAMPIWIERMLKREAEERLPALAVRRPVALYPQEDDFAYTFEPFRTGPAGGTPRPSFS